jgi:pyridoxal phosphate enzyme (YggS family)
MDERGLPDGRIRTLLASMPVGVAVVAAAKTRAPEELREALAAGIHVLGENYVQEAEAAQAIIGREAAEWHLIGHLQRNKVREAVRLFDCIQTVDSIRLAERIDEECRKLDRVMSVLIEVNSGREPRKTGVPLEETEALVRAVADLPNVRIDGLMTMGPLAPDPEELRPAFRETKRAFDGLARLGIPHVRMRVLSMGMSDSYSVAIEEGATMIRLGTALFGERKGNG